MRMLAGDRTPRTRWLWPYCCSHSHAARAAAVTALKRSEKKLINITTKHVRGFAVQLYLKHIVKTVSALFRDANLVDNENIHVCPFLGVNFHWWFTRLCCTTHSVNGLKTAYNTVCALHRNANAILALSYTWALHVEAHFINSIS